MAIIWRKYNENLKGPSPKWAEITSHKSFVEYAEKNFQQYKYKDVMLIHSGVKVPELKFFCKAWNWKYYSRNEVRGSEASFVIVYDFDDFEYEICTRAKHDLLFVTFVDKR